MPVLISHDSALDYWRAVPPQVDTSTEVPAPLSVAEYSTAATDLAAFDPADYGISRTPLHVLGGKDVRRSAAANVKPHTCALASLPASAVRAIAPQVYVSSPEFTFAQMAWGLGEVGAALVGFELCGDYSHFSAPISGFYDRSAITSTEQIAQTLAQLKGLYGLSSAQRALRLVIDSARSPMETVLACMLSFPVRLGGFSFEAPQLNYEVALDETASRLAGLYRCLIDVAWPKQRVGLEYNGAAFHQDAEKDRRRAEALRSMGWSIFTVDAGNITSYRGLTKVVGLLEGTVPHHADGRAPVSAAKVLLDRLLGMTRFGWGMNSVLFGVPVPAGAVQVHL